MTLMFDVRARLSSAMESLSIETVVLIIVLGLVLGVFPAFGLPTFLCILASLVLRLNFAAIQLVNNLSSPLQLTLLVPFNRAGARLFGAEHSTPAPDLPAMLLDPRSVASAAGMAVVHAIAAWFCICLPIGVMLYFILTHAFRRREAVSAAS